MRYIIGFVLFIAALVILLIFIFRGGSKNSSTTVNGNRVITLTDYENTDAQMKLTIDGPIVATENHRAIRISISRSSRTLDVVQGYNGDTIQSKIYPNDPASYQVFIRALQKLNFTAANKGSTQTDERGFCPSGNRYIYEINNPSDQLMRLWGDSCGDSAATTGTTHGPTIRQLFKDQIPDYTQLTTDAAGL